MDINYELNQILNCINAGLFYEANRALESVKLIAPDHPNVHMLSAFLALKLGRPFDYLYLLEEEVALHPEHQQAAQLLAEIKNQIGWTVSEEAFSEELSIADVITHPESIKSILWFRLDLIGDNVIASGMLPYIKDRFSNAEITAICKPALADFYKADPLISNVIEIEPDNLSLNSYRLEKSKLLRSLKADLALNTVYSRNLSSDFLVFQSNARCKIGFAARDGINSPQEMLEKNSLFYNHTVNTPHHFINEIEAHGFFLRDLGINCRYPMPRIVINDNAKQNAATLTASIDLSKTLIVAAGASAAYKRYPHLKDAVVPFCKKHGLSVIALGSTSEAAEHDVILEGTDIPFLNLCGKTTLSETAAILSNAAIALTNDSALSHITNAVKCKNVILVGGLYPGRFSPHLPSSVAVMHTTDCFGCNGTIACKPTGCIPCLEQIPPALVTEALEMSLTSEAYHPRLLISKDCKTNQILEKVAATLNCSLGLELIKL